MVPYSYVIGPYAHGVDLEAQFPPSTDGLGWINPSECLKCSIYMSLCVFSRYYPIIFLEINVNCLSFIVRNTDMIQFQWRPLSSISLSVFIVEVVT